MKIHNEEKRIYYQANREKIKVRVKAYQKANIEHLKVYRKKYREKSTDKIKVRAKAWYCGNIDKKREYNKVYHSAYYQLNKETLKAHRKAYRQANSNKIKIRDKIYNQLNPEKIAIRCRKRKALRLGVGHEPYTNNYIFNRDRWTCQLCGEKINKRLKWPNPRSKSLDHIMPLSKGGNDSPTNVQASHLRCNMSKHAVNKGQLRLFG